MSVSLYVRQRGTRSFVLAQPKAKYPYPETIFVLRYRVNGKRIWETLPPGHDYNMARVKAKLREADLLRGVSPSTPALGASQALHPIYVWCSSVR
jgi:hypothetical protein